MIVTFASRLDILATEAKAKVKRKWTHIGLMTVSREMTSVKRDSSPGERDDQNAIRGA